MTTILNAYPKPALIGWAAKVTAEFAVRERRQVYAIAEADESAAIEVVKGARFKISDPARQLGTDVHAVIASGATPTEAERPHLESYGKWMAEAKATVVAHELKVVSTDYGYGGTTDLVTDSGFGRILLDVKTGGNVYNDAHLQVAAYMKADIGLPRGVQGCGILHVTPELTTLHLTSNPEDAFEAFLACMKIAEYDGMLRKDEQWSNQ